MVRNSYTLTDMQLYAQDNNGLCLSTEYKNNFTPLLWKHLSCGNTWTACWRNINNLNTWCPYCSYKIPSLNTLMDFAKTKQGFLLSATYVSSSSPLLWKCNNDHQWKATWNNIRKDNGTWCPECYQLKSEKECISLFSSIFNIPFTKHRIYFNTSNKKQYLEFDGYNETSKIAVEYHGRQHYELVSLFHKETHDFLDQLRRDSIKREYCNTNNIHLFEVPYTQSSSLSKYINNLYLEFINGKS